MILAIVIGVLLSILLAGAVLLARFGEAAFSWGSSKWEHDDPGADGHEVGSGLLERSDNVSLSEPSLQR